jgi:hypothetical protein
MAVGGAKVQRVAQMSSVMPQARTEPVRPVRRLHRRLAHRPAPRVARRHGARRGWPWQAGMELTERQLGGTVIEEIEEP